MATISKLGFWRHLRAEPNEHILHFRQGKLDRRGAGLSYWFNPLHAAIALVPVEDCETTFVLNERTTDFQEVSVQLTVAYRFVDAEKAASRANFTISLVNGRWVETPLERLANLWAQRSRHPARMYLQGVTIDQAVRSGAEAIRAAVEASLRDDDEIKNIGVAVVTVQVAQVAPTPEVQKALETPTREAIQQKADEAIFQRRALAVEKERAIKENELSTEIELARKHENLLRQQGANKLLEIQSAAAAEQARVEAELNRQALAAQGYARDTQVRADGDAAARRTLGEAQTQIEAQMSEVWGRAGSDVLLGVALRELAGKIDGINHLNITPDLVGEGLRRLLERRGERP